MFEGEKCVSSNNLNISIFNGASVRRSVLCLATIAVLVLGLLGFASPAKAADDAAATFKSQCVVCHGADGTGSPTGKSLKVADLNSDAVQKTPNAQLAAVISDGKNNMPPFKNSLTKEQIDGLVAYVKATFGKKK
jgi:cytochrome c6